MFRAFLAVLAAILLVGVLSALIIESRAVNEDDYVAHAERMRAIETTRNDLAAIVQSTRSAFEDGRPVSSSTTLAFARLVENNALLQETDSKLRANASLDAELLTYDAELDQFIENGDEFSKRQNALADALRDLQVESPEVVKDLRQLNLGAQSQSAFSLAIDVIEFATNGNDVKGEQLAERVEALRSDSAVEARASGRLDAFAIAANNVIEQHDSAAEALLTINGGRIIESLWSLSNTILVDNRRTVSRAERARLLLSVCAVMLLLGTGYAMLRLQSSYRELNESNRELEKVNTSLEDRVTERTQELSAAYDDLKESQVQLVQAEKMSSLGELVAGISHEINTPLWYLISNSTILQERMETVSDFCAIGERMIEAVKSRSSVKESVSQGLLDMQTMLKDGMTDDIAESRDLLTDSIEGLEELTELAQSLKDFSRLDRARHGEFDVNDGLDKTLLIAKNKLKNKATIHKYYSDVPPIHCSPSQINQIFLNLLTNAADAIEESGEIVLRTVADNDTVRISVADTGSGIAAENLEKIRDPFFTTKDVGKGTGLGLSIVDQIITAHGGELSIQSELGKGTTVTIQLPIHATGKVSESETEFGPYESSETSDSQTNKIIEPQFSIRTQDNQNDIPDVVTV